MDTIIQYLEQHQFLLWFLYGIAGSLAVVLVITAAASVVLLYQVFKEARDSNANKKRGNKQWK